MCPEIAPLNGVIGLTNLALGNNLSPEQSRNLTDSLRCADDLLTIINELLDFSKIEAGKLQLEAVDFQLEDVLDGIARVARPLAAAKGIEFVMRVDTAAPTLIGDPTRLRQAILNLVSNAIKFTAEGEVTLRASAQPSSDGGFKLDIAVRDTGPGIDAETQLRLFEPFSQADESTTRRFGGTGLGLSITKHLVEAMGGSVAIESELGAGATFHLNVTLPAQHADALPRHGRLAPNLRALIVDDNASARDVLAGYLRNFDMTSDSAASGEEALERLATERYDVVLSDLGMQGMDGIELVRRVRADAAFDSTHLVLVTGYGGEDTVRESRSAGANAVVFKPVRPSMLFDALVPLLGRELDVASSPAAAAVPDQLLRGLRILIVEDNEINQRILGGLLERAGATITAAYDGRQGVAAAKVSQPPFDLVLMDVQMPTMDGLDATRALRAVGVTTPVIGVTAHALAESRAECLEAGMNDVLTKPIAPDTVLATVAHWGRRAIATDRLETFTTEPPDGLAVSAAVSGRSSGVNMRDGLARTGGNVTLYRDILRRFCSSYLSADAEIARLLADGARDEALRLAHTLKGVAGNIGADEVALAAQRLETAIAAGTDAALNQSLGELARCLAAIAEAGPLELELTTAQLARSVPLDLPRLRRLIAESDASALIAFRAMRDTLSAVIPASHLEALGEALEAYDFEQALELVAERIS